MAQRSVRWFSARTLKSKQTTRLAMSRLIVAAACAALLFLLGSCDGRQDADSRTSQPPSNAICLDAQRAAFPGLVNGWRKFAIALTAGDSGAGPVIEPWTSALAKARAEMAKGGCPDPPREPEAVMAFTTDLSKNPDQISADQARSLGGLLSELRKTLQVSPAEFDERLLDLPMTCDEISSKVNATYEPRRVVTSSGRDIWAVMSVRNKSSRDVYVAVDGHLAISHQTKGSPGRVLWKPTSTKVNADPFKTSKHPLLGPDGKRLHVSSDGRVTSLAVTLSVGFSAERIDCAIPARLAGGAVSVAAAGDIACDPNSPDFNNGSGVKDVCHMKATSDLVRKMKPDAVFALGDLQYQAGSLSNFEDSYDPTWGRFKDLTYPVPGDHEYGSPGAEGYFTYFGSRATPQDPDCLASCRGYYSYDLGAWHVVAVNVNCHELPDGDGCSRRSAQTKWLERDLKAANKTTACTVVLMHEPRWSSSHKKSPELAPFIRTMYRNGVELVLSGDSHTYERFAPQTPASRIDKTRGITQIVVGTGGAHFTDLERPRESNSVTSMSHIFGVLQLTLQDGSYKWTFRADPATPFKDSGRQDCH
jgi:Calcineurin-like phosphoesterase